MIDACTSTGMDHGRILYMHCGRHLSPNASKTPQLVVTGTGQQKQAFSERQGIAKLDVENTNIEGKGENPRSYS